MSNYISIKTTELPEGEIVVLRDTTSESIILQAAGRFLFHKLF